MERIIFHHSHTRIQDTKKSRNRKRKIFALIMSFFFIVSGSSSHIYARGNVGVRCEKETEENISIKESELYAKAAVLLDGESGRVLFEKKGNLSMPMASTTKILTCIVILENSELDEKVTVSKYAASMPDVQLNIREGEQHYIKDLLYSLMLESHNDTSVALAEHVGKSVEGFAELMNQKAKEIGCTETYFITPNGLDATDAFGTHSTTATDLARIMRYCIKESPQKDMFLEITRTASYSFSDIEGRRSYSCQNHNAFLNMMEGAISGKTGFTGNAGYCYVGALERNGKIFVVALLACGWPNNKTYKWSDTKKLMNYGLSNYEYRDVWKPITLNPILVEDGIPQNGKQNDKAYVETRIDLKGQKEELRMLLRKDEKVEMKYEVEKLLYAPVKKETEVGNVTYFLNGEVICSYPVLVTQDVLKVDFQWCMYQIWKQFLDIF